MYSDIKLKHLKMLLDFRTPSMSNYSDKNVPFINAFTQLTYCLDPVSPKQGQVMLNDLSSVTLIYKYRYVLHYLYF